MPLGSIPSTEKNKKDKMKLGEVVHACDPSTWEAETGGSRVRGQPQLLSEALCNLVRPCFKIKEQKIGLGYMGYSSEVECPWVQSPVPQKKKK